MNKLLMLLMLNISILFGGNKTDDQFFIMIKFNSNDNLESLISKQNTCHNRDIELSYQKLEFNDENKLKRISFSVKIEDIYSGSGTYVIENDSTNVGFYYIKSSHVPIPFYIGDF